VGVSDSGGVTGDDVREALKTLDTTQKELEEILKRGHSAAIANGYWGSLAAHVGGLVALALKRERCKTKSPG
jgi:hypothetical protein